MPLGMLGKYEKLDVLGHGVSGVVYLARDTLLNRQVALKEVDVQASDVNRFLEEARVMDRLRHPNIVGVEGVDVIDGRVVIALEYVRGQNLQSLLRSEGPLPLGRALDIAAQALDGLAFAHLCQIVHRDIKPANILVSRDGMVKLADFGLAEILATNAYAGGAGTYAYMAPEDFAAEQRSDQQSDIWAMGVTLYEIIAGRRPFQVENPRDPFAWKRTLENERPISILTLLPEAPDGLQIILNRALAREKRERYESAGEFREEVLRLREALAPEEAEWLRAAPPAETADSSSPPISIPPAAVPPVAASLPLTLPEPMQQGALKLQPGSVLPAPFSEPAAGTLAAASQSAPLRRRFFGAKQMEQELVAEPDTVDFGAIRKGEAASVRIKVRSRGIEGGAEGRIEKLPDWLEVSPVEFSGLRETLILTAHSGDAWETGDFRERLKLSGRAGQCAVALRMTVLPPRPSFLQVAIWYLPLYALSLLPLGLLASARLSSSPGKGYAIALPAALSSAALSFLLLRVCAGAETGRKEKFACVGLLLFSVLVFATLYGGAHRQSAYAHAVRLGLPMLYVVTAMGLITASLQFLHYRKWGLWAVVTACLGLFWNGLFLRILSGGR